MKPVGASGRTLRSIGIFGAITDDALERVAARCLWSAYDEGEQIVPYLDERDDVFFLVSGRARVMIYSTAGKAVAFRDIIQGSLFGELAAIDHQPRSASVEASESTVVARLPAEGFRTALRAEPVVMDAVMRHLVAQIRDLTARVFEYSTLGVNTRIQVEILRLAGNPPPGSAAVLIRGFPRHNDLAEHVSTHREAVTRELGGLTRAGIIARNGRDLLVLDPAALRALIRKGGSGRDALFESTT